jgi:hypothetical protein
MLARRLLFISAGNIQLGGNMKKNMGRLDRVFRVSLAIVLTGMAIIGPFGPVIATLMGVAAVVFVVTSSIGFCPLYIPFNHNTIEEITEDEKEGRTVV